MSYMGEICGKDSRWFYFLVIVISFISFLVIIFEILERRDNESATCDMGYADGYGLPKEIAQWICDMLNECGEECPYKMHYGFWERI